jgi:pimeloyl-ACP methyl ester carboxylesterase
MSEWIKGYLDHQRAKNPDPSGGFLFEPQSRRTFFQKTGRTLFKTALVTSGVINVDTFAGDVLWGSRSAAIGTLENPEAAHWHPKRWTFVTGGWNIPRVSPIAEAIAPSMTAFSQVAYIEDSNRDFDIEKTKAKLRAFVKSNDVREAYLYGHSMGGMEAIELGAHLAEMGVFVPAIVRDCSPTSFLDIRDVKQRCAGVLATADDYKARFGPLVRMGIEMVIRFTDGRSDVGRIIEDSIREIAPANCSNAFVMAQAKYMYQFDITKFSDSFDPNTKFVLLHPDKMQEDQTINNETSIIRLKAGLPNHEVIEQPVIGGGHADPTSVPDAYNRALMQAAAAAHFFNPKLLQQYPHRL